LSDTFVFELRRDPIVIRFLQIRLPAEMKETKDREVATQEDLSLRPSYIILGR
jgi:hypothetical protein